MVLVGDAMETLIPRFERLDPPIVFHHYFGAFSGGPGMTIWYAFKDRAAKDRAIAAGIDEHIRRQTESVLVERGYPSHAVPLELQIEFTSDEEIEAGGGRFGFFR